PKISRASLEIFRWKPDRKRLVIEIDFLPLHKGNDNARLADAGDLAIFGCNQMLVGNALGPIKDERLPKRWNLGTGPAQILLSDPKKGRLHRTRGNFRELEEKCGETENRHHRHEKLLHVLADSGVRIRLEPFSRRILELFHLRFQSLF